METLTKDITLGFYNETGILTVPISQGDIDRIIAISFTNDGYKYEIPDDTVVYFKALKPDGTQINTDECCSIVDNMVHIQVFKQLSAVAGIIACELILGDSSGKIYTSNQFNIAVKKSVHADENLKSSDTYKSIIEILLEVQSLKQDIENLKNDLVFKSEKDQPNGVPSLDENAKIPRNELYDADLKNKGVVRLVDSVESDSTTDAATPNSVKTVNDDLQSHKINKNNPHETTKAQVGLSNCDNTSDKDKPVSTAQQNAIDSAISNHNTSESAHVDIRTLISELTTRLNTIADSDDTTLDQLSEIVAYIKNNKDLIDGITTSKVNVSDIVNDLISTDINKPLSAKQGKILKDLIDTLTINVEDITVPTKTSELINDSNFLTKNGDSSITKSTGQYEGIEGDILLDINSDGYPTLNILKGSNLLRKKFAEIIEWSNKYTIKLKELFNSKVDKVDGKGLSSNDFTDEDKNTLSELANGSINNSTQSDWNVTDTNSGAYIKNKPTKLSQFTNDAGYSKLSFTPVQQSGGIGQSTNKVYIGWDNKGHLKATVDKTDMGSILTTGNPNSGINDLVKKAGDTMTGPLNFANNTWNAVGDDVKIGNVNQAGKLGIMGNNGHTGISFFKQNDASKKKDIVYDGINLNVASSDVVTNSQLNSGDPAYLPPGLYDNNGNGDIGSTGQGRYFNVIHMGEYGNFATQLLMPYQTGYQTRAYIRKQDGGNWSAMQELVSTLNLNTYLANQPAFTELKNSVSNGKAQVASAITAKGVSTAANATFATMASNIASIIAGGSGVYFSKYQAGSKTITANDNYKFGFGVSLGEFTLKINNVDVTNKCISTEGGVHIKLKFYNFPINAGDVFTMVTSANYYAVFVLG